MCPCDQFASCLHLSFRVLFRADELSQGLMADQDTDDSRVGGGTGGGYSGPVPGFEHPPATGLSSADAGGGGHSRAASSHVPSQVRPCVGRQAARECMQTDDAVAHGPRRHAPCQHAVMWV